LGGWIREAVGFAGPDNKLWSRPLYFGPGRDRPTFPAIAFLVGISVAIDLPPFFRALAIRRRA